MNREAIRYTAASSFNAETPSDNSGSRKRCRYSFVNNTAIKQISARKLITLFQIRLFYRFAGEMQFCTGTFVASCFRRFTASYYSQSRFSLRQDGDITPWNSVSTFVLCVSIETSIRNVPRGFFTSCKPPIQSITTVHIRNIHFFTRRPPTSPV